VKPRPCTKVAVLAIPILCLYMNSAQGLQIQVTSWVGTNQVGQADLRLVKKVISNAVDIYGTVLAGPRTIRLEVEFQDLGDTTCATGGPCLTHTEAGLPGIWHPCPLASQLVNRDVPPSPAFHAHITVNSRMINQHTFDCSLAPEVPAGRIDLLHVVLHELGHCMGFVNLVNGDGSWFGNPGSNPSDLHSWFLWYEAFLGDYVHFVLLNQVERSIALASDSLYWGGSNVVADAGGYFQVYAPAFSPPELPENNASHWDPSHLPDELMEPFVTNNVRDLGRLTPALRDLGWALGPIVMVPPYAEIPAPPAKSGSAQPVYITNNRDVNTSVDLEIIGPHASQFTASGVPSTVNVVPYETHVVNVSGSPTSLGYKMATLRAEYNDGAARVVEAGLSMFAIGPDADGDGLSDNDETRDLDLATPGVQNPFNSAIADATGEDSEESADGVSDGDNDFDGDGMTNAEEFVFGYNPVDAHSFGIRYGSDTDGDGMSDANETRDLDPDTPGVQNPFDPFVGDSTGDYPNEDTPDGVPDGQNDYDGDGLDNDIEIGFGLNPMIPDTGVSIPASRS